MNEKSARTNSDGLLDWHKKAAKADHLFLFSDYDGTLAEFHADPDRARPRAKIPGLLGALNEILNYSPVIVTGRPPGDIRKLMPKPLLPVIGLHGLLYLPPGNYEPRPLPPDLPRMPENLIQLLREINNKNSQIKLEDKGVLKALHFDSDADQLYTRILSELKSESYAAGWEVIAGRQVLELKPEDWDKGRAVEKMSNIFAEELGINRRDATLIYLGDDVTDEYVFERLREDDLGIYIKNEDNSVPSQAHQSLENPAQVEDFLENLIKISREK